MKTAGWIFVVIGALGFLGAVAKGHSVFGPLFWIGLGSMLIYLKKEREESNKQKVTVEPPISKQMPKYQIKKSINIIKDVEHNAPITFEQKEAALCLVAFFAGYNDDIMTNDTVYMISYQSADWFGIDNYREVITTAIPKYQDADKLIDTVLSIHDKKNKRVSSPHML